MDVAEKILQQLARQKVPGSFIEGVIPEADRSQGNALVFKPSDDRSRGGFEAVHPKVIGKTRSEALHKQVEIGNELAVLFK
jgi:hypothetical protein